MKSNRIGAIVFVLLIFVTGYVIFKDNSLQDIIQTIKMVNPVYLLLAVLTMFVYVMLQSGNLYVTLSHLKQKPRFRRCLEYSFIEFYFSAITPSATGGQPMQVYYMQRDNISVSVASLTVLLYVFSYQTVFLLYSASMFIIKYPLLKSVNIHEIRFFLIYGAAASLLLISGVMVMVFSKRTAHRIAEFFVRLFAKIRIVKDKERALAKVDAQMDEYANGVDYLKKNLSLFARLFVLMFLQLSAFFSIPYFIYLSFGLSGYGLFDVIAMQCMVHLSAASLPLPGAVGANENNFYRLFKTIYPQSMIFPALLLSRGVSFYGFMIISGVIAAIAHFRTKRTDMQV